MTLTLGHSPDPDDAFMFYALAEQKIDTRGYRFEHILQDIQTLNERATRGELHISAISIHAYAYVLKSYALLPCGASMGDGYGPLLIAKNRDGLSENPRLGEVREWLRERLIAVPGTMTSAYLAMRLALGECDTIVVPFDEIFDAVHEDRAQVGLIIHEGQLTYEQENFVSILDLGVWWKIKTGLPLPLGGNVIRKDIPPAARKEISDILHESIRYGLEHRSPAVAHSMPLARGMDTALADRFIGMYVNEMTLDYGDTGRRAIHEFLKQGHDAGFLPAPVELEFVS
ncbi:MAG: 1,4-dihydroxy-6-naphthoate synthase [Chthoniobacter sp.]|jgi:1,4-dihydroxy-6-naphthoate synthase|nr:1,4-dihydroxy-6-naphthoate synthase [Chthoniobacter sp.]